MSKGETMEDKQATYLLNCRDKIHLALIGSKKSSMELSNTTGLTPEETAKAIYALKTDHYIETVGLGEHRYHSLTTNGKLNAPPPPVPDFQSTDCDPRKAKHTSKGKNKMRFSGQRHFHGIPGKFPIDKDGAIILNPDNNIGKLFAVLETPKSMNDLRALLADTMPDKTITNTIYFLRKMGLIESTKGRHDGHSLNVRTNIKARLLTDEPEQKETHTNTPPPVTEISAPVPIAKSSLQRDLQVLYTRYSKADLITEVALDLADELEQLKRLRQQMLALSH